VAHPPGNEEEHVARVSQLSEAKRQELLRLLQVWQEQAWVPSFHLTREVAARWRMARRFEVALRRGEYG
jgi:hypothetical protein